MSEGIQIKDRSAQASYKQVAYLGKLMTEEAMGRPLTKGEASDLIELFQAGDWYASAIGTRIEDALNHPVNDQKES